MKNEQKLSITEQLFAARQRVYNDGLGLTDCYTNGMALRAIHKAAASAIQVWLSVNPGAADPLAVGNTQAHIYGLIKSAQFIEFTALDAAFRANEASTAFIEAVAIIQPLVDEVRRLEGLQAEELAVYGRTLQGLEEAEQLALTKAILAIDSDPALAKLRLHAEATRPAYCEAPPFRGKVAIAFALATEGDEPS